MMRALSAPGTPEQRMLLSRVKQVFASSSGRTVPIKTATWGQWLKEFIMLPTVGTNADVYQEGHAITTKWQYCDFRARKVPIGFDGPLGLQGEVGMRAGTQGDFQRAQEKAQIFADFKVGQIPFYTYHYGTGNVTHNAQEIWHGQTIGERMAGLFQLFPAQINL